MRQQFWIRTKASNPFPRFWVEDWGVFAPPADVSPTDQPVRRQMFTSQNRGSTWRLWQQTWGVFAPPADVAPTNRPLLIPQYRFNPATHTIVVMSKIRNYQRWEIRGNTYDSNNAILPNCTVRLFRSDFNTIVDTQTSDANGLFIFALPFNATGMSFWIDAYLSGSPDVAGTTVRTLAAN